ncbi:MAG: hydrogenase formation protein HypD [Merismopediaceae bacterium]|nr:hydrogenase formation protein HypD [Merismopediaceae bacterium]
MKYLHEFRDPGKAQALLGQIEHLTRQLGLERPLKIMEVCGGHTHAIFKAGLESLLPAGIELVHGPGCPVCIMPRGRIDEAIALSQLPGVILTTFGDVLRVPGSKQSLLQARAAGADIRLVYSPLDALTLAKAHPDQEVVFLAIGFETTAPSTALTVLQAQREGVQNFSLFCNHVLVMPALEALLNHPDLQLDGFIGPGHVSMIIGTEPYQPIAEQYHKPLVVAGFEPLDILQALWMLLKQWTEGRCGVENQYTRLVQPQGNLVAQQAIAQVFTERESFEWRGLGQIPRSGLQIREEYQAFDAERKFSIPHLTVPDHRACQCGEILQGTLKPWECKVFGTACTPENPLGACMVSSEGACAAYYKYGKLTGQWPVSRSSAKTSPPRSPLPV